MKSRDLDSMKGLQEAIQWSREKLSSFREQRNEAIKQFVGKHYGNGGTADKVPVNHLELMVQIFMHLLASSDPRVVISTPHLSLKPHAATFELALNHLIKKIRLLKSLRSVINDSLFSMGIMKIALGRHSSVDLDGERVQVPMPFAEHVSLDDWVHDMAARRMEESQFCGNRYQLPYEEVMDSPVFSQGAKRNLVPSEGNGSLDDRGVESAVEMTREGEKSSKRFRPMLDVWDIWIPSQSKIVTIPARDSSDIEFAEPLREVVWDGPEEGPYRILRYTEVPDNTMPLPLVSVVMDLHSASNQIFRKITRQALRQKTVGLVRAGKEDDGRKIKDASDGEMLAVDDPRNVNEVRFGGADQNNFALMLQFREMFSYFASNMDAIGGLQAQSDTLGQDKLLSNAANQRIASMQRDTIGFVSDVIRDLAFHLWHDPFIELPLVKRVQGVDIDIPVTYSADERSGEFLDYNFTINPYSMQDQTPSMKLQSIGMIFQNYITPFAPMLEQQGMTIDFNALMQIVARYANLPELGDILVSSGGGAVNSPTGPVGEPPRRPPFSKHVTERVSRPGVTRAGRESALISGLMGVGKQPAEQASIFRKGG